MAQIAVIGGGGREEAIAWSLKKEGHSVLCLPGNGGSEYRFNIDITKGETSEERQANFPRLLEFAQNEPLELIVVGPEQPLVDGIVDYSHREGFKKIFGPTSFGAAIEADKFYSFEVMNACGIPQARSIPCSNLSSADDAIKELSTDRGVVLKARGLTGGKGVSVFDSADDALRALPEFLGKYGKDGSVLVAERLFGQEFSVFGISDGNRVFPFPIPIQDHKRLLVNDEGPNTGGMGAYGPAPIANAEIVKHVADTMMTPAVQFMRDRRVSYKGFLYAAVIDDVDKGLKILEYNCRLGDPETQPLVMMLKHGLYRPIMASLNGTLNESLMEVNPGAACTVVLISNGYPGQIQKGFKIGGLEKISKEEDTVVFHAGTAINNEGSLVTSGGRVLGVTSYSPKGIADAQKKAYAATVHIAEETKKLNGGRDVLTYRSDIADKALLTKK